MIVGREEIVQLEELGRQQKRIWNDSCDMGIMYSVQLRDKLHAICTELKQTFKMTVDRWHNGTSCEFFIPIERDGQEYEGMKVRIAKHTVKKLCFFSIDILRASQVDSGFKNS